MHRRGRGYQPNINYNNHNLQQYINQQAFNQNNFIQLFESVIQNVPYPRNQGIQNLQNQQLYDDLDQEDCYMKDMNSDFQNKQQNSYVHIAQYILDQLCQFDRQRFLQHMFLIIQNEELKSLQIKQVACNQINQYIEKFRDTYRYHIERDTNFDQNQAIQFLMDVAKMIAATFIRKHDDKQENKLSAQMQSTLIQIMRLDNEQNDIKGAIAIEMGKFLDIGQQQSNFAGLLLFQALCSIKDIDVQPLIKHHLFKLEFIVRNQLLEINTILQELSQKLKSYNKKEEQQEENMLDFEEEKIQNQNNNYFLQNENKFLLAIDNCNISLRVFKQIIQKKLCKWTKKSDKQSEESAFLTTLIQYNDFNLLLQQILFTCIENEVQIPNVLISYTGIYQLDQSLNKLKMSILKFNIFLIKKVKFLSDPQNIPKLYPKFVEIVENSLRRLVQSTFTFLYNINVTKLENQNFNIDSIFYSQFDQEKFLRLSIEFMKSCVILKTVFYQYFQENADYIFFNIILPLLRIDENELDDFKYFSDGFSLVIKQTIEYAQNQDEQKEKDKNKNTKQEAGEFLQCLCFFIDGTQYRFIQYIIGILLVNLGIKTQQEVQEYMPDLNQENIFYFKCKKFEQLDVSLLTLSIFNTMVRKRQDMKQLVQDFFVLAHDQLLQLEDPVLKARVITTFAYYQDISFQDPNHESIWYRFLEFILSHLIVEKKKYQDGLMQQAQLTFQVIMKNPEGQQKIIKRIKIILEQLIILMKQSNREEQFFVCIQIFFQKFLLNFNFQNPEDVQVIIKSLIDCIDSANNKNYKNKLHIQKIIYPLNIIKSFIKSKIIPIQTKQIMQLAMDPFFQLINPELNDYQSDMNQFTFLLIKDFIEQYKENGLNEKLIEYIQYLTQRLLKFENEDLEFSGYKVFNAVIKYHPQYFQNPQNLQNVIEICKLNLQERKFQTEFTQSLGSLLLQQLIQYQQIIGEFSQDLIKQIIDLIISELQKEIRNSFLKVRHLGVIISLICSNSNFTLTYLHQIKQLAPTLQTILKGITEEFTKEKLYPLHFYERKLICLGIYQILKQICLIKEPKNYIYYDIILEYIQPLLIKLINDLMEQNKNKEIEFKINRLRIEYEEQKLSQKVNERFTKEFFQEDLQNNNQNEKDNYEKYLLQQNKKEYRQMYYDSADEESDIEDTENDNMLTYEQKQAKIQYYKLKARKNFFYNDDKFSDTYSKNSCQDYYKKERVKKSLQIVSTPINQLNEYELFKDVFFQLKQKFQYNFQEYLDNLSQETKENLKIILNIQFMEQGEVRKIVKPLKKNLNSQNQNSNINIQTQDQLF